MPGKKIFDIIPPQKPEEFASPSELKEKPAFAEGLAAPAKKKVIPEKPAPLKRKTLIFIGVGVVLAAVFSCIFIKPKAEIEIWPELKPVNFKTQAVVDSSNAGGTIPGKLFKIEKNLSQEFSSTGTKLKTVKASGIIRVYNNYSTSPQPLVATTRFVSADGKLFRTPRMIVVPGAYYEGGKLIPGTIDIEAVADQPGPEYNIGPSTFSIPGFAGTPKYTAFYAKSFEPMTGGLKTQVPQVTKEDLDGAKEILTAMSLKEAKTSLESSILKEEYLLMEGVMAQEPVKFSPLDKEGQEAEKFVVQATAEAEALAFKKLELEDFAKVFVETQIPQTKKLNENALQIKYSVASVNLKEGKITLSIEISTEIYTAISEDSLKELIKNKKPEAVKELLKDFPEISKAKVHLWPFWAMKIPKELDRISIKLRVD